MPSVASALLAMALHERPVTDAGVWLDAPPAPGTVVTAPLTLTGETQAPEGVLSVTLYAGPTPVAVYKPVVPVGTVEFSFTWDPKGVPGAYDVRVVATTLVRGFSQEVRGLVVPAPRRAARPAVAPRRVATRPVALSRPVARRVVAKPVDDSGRAFGRAAPTLPYAPAAVRPAPVRAATLATDPVSQRDRRGWVSFAAGLMVLLVCSHLHRSLRPPPRGTT